MDSGLFFGGSAIAAFVAGMIALFAPCCISVMLPAYFAASFRNRAMLTAMTFLYAAGVATVILPLVLGASLLRQILVSQHEAVFVGGGVLMLGLAAFVLLGGKLELPMPSRRAGQKAGPLGIYSLGVFSGIASSCCAPVLAGVLALSSLAPSTALALALGTAYVFGMVAPLFAITLLWERYDWRASRLFRPRSVTWRIGRLERTLSMSAVATGVLLALMGVATIWAGLAGDAMPSGGWWTSVAIRLQYYGQQITRVLTTLPGWLTAATLIAVAVWLARRAFRQLAPRGGATPPETHEDLEDHSRSNR
ncbi:MAG TPA: cytochrome c biogenesis CcdA family protein [Casimicrobiaceae bacterium]